MSANPFDVTNGHRADPARVIDDMKRLAVEQLGALPGALYTPIEDALQAPATSPDSLHDHAALLLLRQHSASHVMRFRQHVALGFDDFGGVARARAPKAPLGLIDERLLDFHLAGQRLGEILDQRYQLMLDQLKGRLGALSAALHLAPGLNPLAPSRLVAAFLEAIGDAELPPTLSGALFQQYQLELVRVLDDLYPRVTGLLAAAGYSALEPSHRSLPMQADRAVSRQDDQVAPRFVTPSAATPADGAMAGAGARGAAGSWGAASDGAVAPASGVAATPADAYPAASQSRTSGQLSGLREQLHAWRNDLAHGETGNHAKQTPQRRELRVQEVTSIASLLQAESPDVYARALAMSGRLSGAIRNELMLGARRLGLSPDETRFSVDEEDAIDMVAMLFEGLFRTHSLQERARRLYARLVLPYVKVALHDDAMFVQAGHPARRLLDAITEACEGNDAGTAQDRELLERAAAVSQRVVAEFNEDVAVFELAHAELDELLQQQRRRVELQQDRAAKATYGRERLAEARAQADRMLQRRLAAPPLTQAVADFLITPWRHHLVQTLLRDGADSVRHADAARLGDGLVNADRLAEAGRGRDLADCLIALEPAIVQCQASSGLDDTAARHGMAWLVGALAQPERPRLLHEMPARSSEDGGDDEARLWLAGGTATVPHDAGVAALIRRMQAGEWLRMIGVQGEATAVKIAWVSPLTSRLLLVNRRGLRVLAASVEELAGLVSAGRLAIAAENTPFDEAMQQMRHRLDHAVGQR